MTAPIEFDARSNTATSGGQSLVFHCHFYNCALQRAVEEGLGDQAPAVLQDGAADVIFAQLITLGEGLTGPEIAALAVETYAQLGFGTLDLSAAGEPGGGEATVHASHYAMGWVAVYGERDTPSCHFAAGFVRATVAASRGIALSAVRVHETGCFACGADDCRFEVVCEFDAGGR